MAFHVACPITCRRICFCSVGFPRKLQSDKAKNGFLEDVARVEEFLKDPWLLKAREIGSGVQVSVPKVVVTTPAPVIAAAAAADGADAEELLSAQTKRAAMQRKAAAASMVAEDYARRFESGDMAVGVTDLAGGEQGQLNAKVMCRLCFSGENEGSERARKMLSCKSCSKKYHRSCLKSWAQHRDLFHWSSWTCPTCRICEVCRRTGDPNKLMFCKRCDGAYHCYCQQPPHKNVSSGPYLCPKHTRCHSCGSTVPGNGLSVRWFLGYTCCDACGRLFVKGNYCPVCLKVYRDSESTPMVCCDVCQRWVHCHCDGISDEKYLQFQVDGNLQYRCATCRGECYQVRDLEDAVQELWRRKDSADRDLTASLRAAAGLPTEEEIFSISPYSDDDEGPIPLKNEYGRSLKFSLKGLVDKSPKKSKEYGKKSSNKKYGKKKGYLAPLSSKTEPHYILEGHSDAQSTGYITSDNKDEDVQSHRSGEPDMVTFPVAGSLTDGVCSINQAGVLKHRFIDEVTAKRENRVSRTVKVNDNRSEGLDTAEDDGKLATKSKATKGPKLVIHLGARNRNAANSPMSDASNYPREQEVTTSNGSEDMSQQRFSDKLIHSRVTSVKLPDPKGENIDWTDQLKGSKLRGKEGKLIKIKKLNAEVAEITPVHGGGRTPATNQSVSPVKSHVLLGKRSVEGGAGTAAIESPIVRGEKVSMLMHEEGWLDLSGNPNDRYTDPPLIPHNFLKDPKRSLKLKFKNPYSENQSSWAASGEEERSFVKGQRSKRKRPSPFMEKTSAKEDKEPSHSYEDNMMNEIMDANWIIQKLGRDAIGKRVEVHQPSNKSWHKGTVTEVLEGTSVVSVALDDGNTKSVDLSKQGIRFVSQRQKR